MIAAALDTYGIFGREIQDGIYRYALNARPDRWQDLVAIPNAKLLDCDLAGYHLDGIIVGATSKRLQREVQRLGVPAINVSGSFRRPVFPSVHVDNRRLGEIAAEYFLQHDHQHFVFVASPRRYAYAEERGRGFASVVADAGYSVQWRGRFPSGLVRGAEHSLLSNTELLRSCPKPVAVFAIDDYVAAAVHASAEAIGLDVPSQVAVLGVNDEPNMHLGSLGLSSIVQPFNDIGYEAAARLDRLMDGQKLTPRNLRLPPLGVVARASSDMRAITDSIVIDALKFIREEACNGARVEDVVDALPISRRSLHRRFTEAVGSTVIEELTRVRIARACKLLSRDGISVAEVSEASGFRDRSRFAAAFRAAMNQTPTEYRRKLADPLTRHG